MSTSIYKLAATRRQRARLINFLSRVFNETQTNRSTSWDEQLTGTGMV